MGVRDFESGDDERDPFGFKCSHLSRANLAGNDGEMSGELVGKIYPMIHLEARDDEGVAGADWGDGEEGDTLIVSVDEPSWQVAVDDLGKQGAHGFEIVECNR